MWRDKRLTKTSTIDSGFEFPFTEDYRQLECSGILLHSSEWDVVDVSEVTEEFRREEEGREGGGTGGKGFRDRKGAVANDRTSAPRRSAGGSELEGVREEREKERERERESL